jgi:hypothetical protein
VLTYAQIDFSGPAHICRRKQWSSNAFEVTALFRGGWRVSPNVWQYTVSIHTDYMHIMQYGVPLWWGPGVTLFRLSTLEGNGGIFAARQWIKPETPRALTALIVCTPILTGQHMGELDFEVL